MTRSLAIGLGALLLVAGTFDARAARIKDVAWVDGIRPNQLVGYGLVVGLDGTGDTERVDFTRQSLTAMLSRVGVRIDPGDLSLRNVAAVLVTAELPAQAQPGTPLDVVVSAIGNARSLVGGTLILTPLGGVDGVTYATAQGPLQVGDVRRSRRRRRVDRRHLNVGRVPGGALVERNVPVVIGAGGTLVLNLARPDFATAQRVATAVNDAAGTFGGTPESARATSAATIEVTVPEGRADQLPAVVAALEAIEVVPDTSARVVVNGRTGTVVLGGDVRISTVAVTHDGLTLQVVQAAPAVADARGRAPAGAAGTPAAAGRVVEEPAPLRTVVSGATLTDLVSALNALGAGPRDLVEILQAIDAAGALHGRLEVI